MIENYQVYDSRPLPDVAMTGKCTRECDEYGHSDACWMPVRTSPERRPKATPPKLSTFNSSSAGCSGAEPATSSDPLANGEPSHLLGDRNRNLLNKKMASSSSSSAYDAFGSAAFSANDETSRPVEEIPLAPTGEYKPTQCGTLTRREVYL
ncbi:protocadherin-7b [Tachysurus ichikawai]